MIRVILMLIFCAITGSEVYSQGVETVLRRYRNDQDVFSYTIDGSWSNLFKEVEGEKIESEVEYFSILMFKNDSDLKEKDQARLQEKLNELELDKYIEAREKGSKLEVFAKEKDEFISNTFIRIHYDQNTIYVVLRGNIRLQDLQKLDLDGIKDIVKG